MFPAISVNLPAPIDMLPVHSKFVIGVNKTVYSVPAPVRLETLPPVLVISPRVSPVTASLIVKEIVAVCHIANIPVFAETTTDGEVVSIPAIGLERE